MKSNIEYIAQNAHPYSVSINSYDNTIDTQLYKRYSTYFKQKQYKEHLRKNMAEMEELLESKYSITRKTTFYFSDFWSYFACRENGEIRNFVSNFRHFANLVFRDYDISSFRRFYI